MSGKYSSYRQGRMLCRPSRDYIVFPIDFTHWASLYFSSDTSSSKVFGFVFSSHDGAIKTSEFIAAAPFV